jgi:hypothetical protein
MTGNKNLDAALELAKRGWKLFPQHSLVNGQCTCKVAACDHAGKHPVIRAWQSKAAASTAQLTKWWTVSPFANIGVKTGRVSNLMVLDVDGDVGEESLRKLEEQYGPLPATLRSTTGDGKHFYFKHPGHTLTIKLSITACAKRLGPGLEIKADGKADCVTVPPSIHANGKSYEWVNADTPIADAPAWLLDLLTIEDVHTSASDNAEIVKGQRNDAMFLEICALFKTGASKEDVLRSALEANKRKCKPPLADAVIRGTVASVAKTHKPGYLNEKSRSSRNPLFWFPFDVHSFFADQNAQTLSDAQLGWRTRLMAFAWEDKGRLSHDLDALFILARASSKKQFKRDIRKALYDFVEVNESGQSFLVNRGMAQQYADKMDGWNQKREAGRARAEAKAAETEKKKRETIPNEVAA